MAASSRYRQAQSYRGQTVPCVLFFAHYLQNTNLFVESVKKPPPTPVFQPVVLDNGGLRLPPFAKRPLGNQSPYTLASYMPKPQAEEMKDLIFEQLDLFDSYASAVPPLLTLIVK